IGPGLGRTAYDARAFGIRNYTTVGLPMDVVCQAAFLGRVLAEHEFAFPNEVARPGQMRMLTPANLLSSNERFDIVINADSITEMDRAHAEAYVAFIAAHAKVFISINHDGNSFRVCDLAALQSAALAEPRIPGRILLLLKRAHGFTDPGPPMTLYDL